MPSSSNHNAQQPFRIWAFGDAHVGSDKRRGRESLAEALRQSEQASPVGFEWDIAINVGDYSGGQDVPDDEEGREIARQYSVLSRHRREQVYDVCGNHDRSGLDEPEAWWFQKWIDPLGQHPEYSGVHAQRRPFPMDGNWERYSFRVGNLLFLMMSDVNEPTQTVGRGTLGGNPGGVVRGSTFAWWQEMVAANADAIIISVHHYLLKDTTTATGAWEGMVRNEQGQWESGYHGYKSLGTPQGASYLYWVDSQPDAQAFESFLAARQPPDAPAGSNAVALWLGGHTHALSPHDCAGGKPMIATKWGVHFLNVCALTKHHVGRGFPTPPMSRLLTFMPGSDEVRVQCFLHTNDFAAQGRYDQAEHTLKLPRAFKMTSS